MRSCLYEGTVRHHRVTPVEHRFEYAIQFAYLDLSELPELYRRGWVTHTPWSSRGLSDDDHFSSGETIAAGVRRLVEREIGGAHDVSVRMLTLLRWRGFYFSPLNMYFVHDAGADENASPIAVVAEVSNTPWRQRHYYVFDAAKSEVVGEHRRSLGFETAKRMHVSPFMEMEQTYRFALTMPGAKFSATLENWQAGERWLSASLELERRELCDAELRRSAWRYPATPLRVLAQIYYQAWRLWIKKCPLYPHPSKHVPAPTAPSPTARPYPPLAPIVDNLVGGSARAGKSSNVNLRESTTASCCSSTATK